MGKLMKKTLQSPKGASLYETLLSDKAVKPIKQKSKKNNGKTAIKQPAGASESKLEKKVLKLVKDQEEEEEFGLSDEVQNENGYVTLSPLSDEEIEDIDEFLPDTSSFQHSKRLAQIILEKFKEDDKEQLVKGLSNESTISAHLRDSYTLVGDYLRHYKSGKIPKAFKIIPRIHNWEEILVLTKPEDWSPNAMYEATRMFASNLTSNKAERFYAWILLPTIREDIAVHKKLNYHYYMALKKAIYKPIAWIKGILFPLVVGGCTLREAVIVGSVLSKVSFPMPYAAAALTQLCQLPEWFATTSYFISILINKKYSFPKQVIDIIVQHLYSFIEDSRKLPVMWQKVFLAFSQRYKLLLTMQQKALLFQLLERQYHAKIGPLIHTELVYVDPVAILNQQHSS